MKQPITKSLGLLLFTFVTTGVCPTLAANPQLTMTNPDFTKGERIPVGAEHEWNLGATGAKGWMYSEQHSTSYARQILITKVQQSSPADTILEVGDVILGVAGKAFSYDPRIEIAKAINQAERQDNKGSLSLTVFRKGASKEVVIKLPVLGSYSATAPYNCSKSALILEKGCQALAKRIKDDPKYARSQNPITRSLNALALLASGKPEYSPLIKEEAKWASEFSAGSFMTWYYGYIIICLSEYQLATGDNSFMPGLKRLALASAKGQSDVGSWGHRFASPEGRCLGYGMMNSPGLSLTTGLVLARDAGVKDPLVDRAIERSAKLFRFYIDKGAVPYGDHEPWVRTHADNGKSGMAATLFNALGEANGTKFFSRMSIATHGPASDEGHTGNCFNILWALPGISLSGPQATGAWMNEFGFWYFDLARRSDSSFAHLGREVKEKYRRWDCTGAYLLAYALPLKHIRLTGKKKSIIKEIDSSLAKRLIDDGRGWSRHTHKTTYDNFSNEQLLDKLSSWSPVVRERGATALGRRENVAIAPLLKLLKSEKLEARHGACRTLEELGDKAAEAVDPLIETLKSEDVWLRISAAKALRDIGKPAMKAVPELLTLLTQVDTRKDPRGMQQRYLSIYPLL